MVAKTEFKSFFLKIQEFPIQLSTTKEFATQKKILKIPLKIKFNNFHSLLLLLLKRTDAKKLKTCYGFFFENRINRVSKFQFQELVALSYLGSQISSRIS